MVHPREPLASAAVLAGASAALHVVYAATGGITGRLATALPLAAAAVLGAVLLWLAWRRGQPWLAVAGVLLGWLPVLATWPVALLSPAGWLVVLLQAAATAMVGFAAFLAQRGAT
jgi:hypothetical protein